MKMRNASGLCKQSILQKQERKLRTFLFQLHWVGSYLFCGLSTVLKYQHLGEYPFYPQVFGEEESVQMKDGKTRSFTAKLADMIEMQRKAYPLKTEDEEEGSSAERQH